MYISSAAGDISSCVMVLLLVPVALVVEQYILAHCLCPSAICTIKFQVICYDSFNETCNWLHLFQRSAKSFQFDFLDYVCISTNSNKLIYLYQCLE